MCECVFVCVCVCFLFFVEEKQEVSNDLRDLEAWVMWWHNRRFNIFRAFTGSNCPRMNQAEVIHAGMVNRIECGVPLDTSAEFDVRDSMYLDDQLEKVKDKGNNAFGCGPTLFDLNERRIERRVDATKRKGADLLLHGVAMSNEIASNRPHSDSIAPPPPKKSKGREETMFQKRKADALISNDFKIHTTVKETEFKRSYKLFTSSRSYVTVSICNMSSCTCKDFEKNKDKVWCKHILFLLFEVFDCEDFQVEVKDRFLSDESLRVIFQNDIPQRYMWKKVKSRSTNEYGEMFTSHHLNNQDQKWLYHLKTGKKARCTAYPCRQDIKVGEPCFSVDGALVVRIGEDNASPQKFFYCANDRCFKSVPKWTNIKFPKCFGSEETREKLGLQ